MLDTSPRTATAFNHTSVPDPSEMMRRITEIDDPIVSGKGNRIARFLWRSVDLDGLIFSVPSHDGEPVDIARQVYHRLAARLVASKAHLFQLIILISAFVLAVLFSGPSESSSAYQAMSNPVGSVLKVLGVALAGAAAFCAGAVPFLMARAYSSSIKDEVQGIIERTFFRSLPDDTPDDLRDYFQQSWLTVDGRPLSSELSPEDGRSTEAQSRTLWWILTGLGVGLMLACVFGFYFASAWYIAALLVAKLVFDSNPVNARASELEVAEGVEGAAYAAAGGKPWGSIPDRARRRQIEEANRDDSPTVTLGTSTGVLAARGDFFAPNAGLPFVLSLRDLQMHLLVLGGTGSGKTSGVLRPIARQIAAVDEVGMVILDGKGALPKELADLDELTLIDPAEETLSLVADMSPEIITDTIAQVLEPPEAKKDPFFLNSGKGVLRRALILARAAGGKFNSLASAAKIVSDNDYRQDVIDTIDPADVDPVMLEAGQYFSGEWAAMAEKTRSNILATVRAWMSALTATPDLMRWAEATPADDTADLMPALQGGRIGLVIPDYRYGEAGAAVTALLKARLYARLKARAETGLTDGQTPVVFLVDEAQEVATREDATMLAIGRSLGLAVIAATQTVEGVNEKLGETLARKWFSIYGGVIALPGRSAETDEFVARRGGEQWRPTLNQIEGLTVRDALTIDSVSGVAAAARQQPHLRKAKSGGVPSKIQEGAQKLIQGLRPEKKAQPQALLGASPIVEGVEMQTLLATPDTALAYVTRARVPRRDVIQLTPDYMTNGHRSDHQTNGQK
jgi:hypothetical protein